MPSNKKRGKCLWCSHPKAAHRGALQATKDRFKAQGAQIKWSPTGCSLPECEGCRMYEA